MIWWKTFYAADFTCASSFGPPKQQHPREISRLFDLKGNNGLNRNCSDCTDVQFCSVGWLSSHQRRTRGNSKNLWVCLSMRAQVCVCVWQREKSVHVISIVRIKWLLCLTVGREFYKGNNTLQGEQRPHCAMAVCNTQLMLKQATISY